MLEPRTRPMDASELLRLELQRRRELISKARFSPDAYTRQLIHASRTRELWLMSWLPGQETAIHDHAGSETATAVLTGELLEETFIVGLAGTVLPHSVSRLRAGEIGPIETTAIHRVRAIGPTVTLHLYVPGYVGGCTYEVAS